MYSKIQILLYRASYIIYCTSLVNIQNYVWYFSWQVTWYFALSENYYIKIWTKYWAKRFFITKLSLICSITPADTKQLILNQQQIHYSNWIVSYVMDEYMPIMVIFMLISRMDIFKPLALKYYTNRWYVIHSYDVKDLFLQSRATCFYSLLFWSFLFLSYQYWLASIYMMMFWNASKESFVEHFSFFLIYTWQLSVFSP